MNFKVSFIKYFKFYAKMILTLVDVTLSQKNSKEKTVMSKLLSSLVIGSFLAVSASATGWVYQDNGQVVQDCCRKAPVKRVVRKVRKPKVCKTCDLTQYPDAQLEAYNGERIGQATLRGCPNR
jgi:hypothetical protein